MIEKPILFNTEMVKAILEGRKTQTRRIAKTIKSFELKENNQVFARVQTNKFTSLGGGAISLFLEKFAPYQVGDILYVRETWQESECFDYSIKNQYCYKANDNDKEFAEEYRIRWRPSIHMPKVAARLFLRVTDVKVERLQDIDKLWDNYDKEGMRNPKTENISIAMQERFIDTWNSTIKKKDLNKYGWEANPWVFVIEFEKIED